MDKTYYSIFSPLFIASLQKKDIPHVWKKANTKQKSQAGTQHLYKRVVTDLEEVSARC